MSARSFGQDDTRATRTLTRTRLAGALAGCLALAGGAGCDTNARFNLNRIGFTELEVIGAYPAVQQNGKLVRQCSVDPENPVDADGLLVNFVMLSTERKSRPGAPSSALDRDRSIRPGDIINQVEVGGPKTIDIKVNPSVVEMKLDCIDGLPDASSQCDEANGTAVSLAASSHGYEAFIESRSQAVANGHNVLLLIDQSASIRGLVDETSNKEGNPNTVVIPPNFSQVASDYTHRRLSAVKEFIGTLNPNDRVGVLAFAEGLGSSADGLRAPCALPEAEGVTWDVGLEACFGKPNKSIWTTGIDTLQGDRGDGRSNLWNAVAKGYTYLREKKDLKRTNHIVVVTDGPDTCLRSSESFTACEKTACASTNVADIIAQIEADAANPNQPQIHVHFVQFESIGYPGPDPRQVEISCLTNGHYQFVNSNQLSNTNVVEFQKALTTAMNRVRYSLQGMWQTAVPAPELKSNSAHPFGTPRGRVYALSGLVEVKPTSKLVTQSQTFTFSNPGAGSHDDRLVVRKPCSLEGDCGTAGDGVCQVGCSDETQTCRGDVNVPNNMECLDGSGGACCDGACVSGGGLCAACN